MKKNVILVTMSMMLLTAHAQDFRFGVNAGGNLNVAAGNLSTGSRAGYHIGGLVMYDLTGTQKGLYATAGLQLTQKGFKAVTVGYYATDEYLHSIDRHTDMGYLELPLAIGMNFGSRKAVKRFVEVGPYLAMGLFGNTKWENDGKETQSHSKVFGKEGFKRMDCGLSISIGMEMADHVRFSLGYEHGLLNLRNNPSKSAVIEKPRYFNRNIKASVAYIF